jgi:urease accessory protein
LGPSLPRGPAGLAGAQAFATVLLIAPEIEARVPAITAAIAEIGAMSCWNGKLVARLAAEDGLKLKKALAKVLAAATGGKGLPRVWAL